MFTPVLKIRMTVKFDIIRIYIDRDILGCRRGKFNLQDWVLSTHSIPTLGHCQDTSLGGHDPSGTV